MEDLRTKIISWYDSLEYELFNIIPEIEKLNSNRKLCGILKLQNLLKDPNTFEFVAEHDELFLPDISKVKEDINLNDIIYLNACSIYFNRELDCFYTRT